jgi:Fur family transcriptional regulator, ferric uptake regulator
MILEAICAGGGHTSLGEIYGRVRRIDPTIDRTTVYRAIKVFLDTGLVVRADTGGDEITYEISGPEPHHHLVCRFCRHETSFDDQLLTQLNQAIWNVYGFRVETDHIVFNGICAGCLEQAPAEQPANKI